MLDDCVPIPKPLTAGCTVGIGFSRAFTTAYTVASFRVHPHRITLRLNEITSKEDALSIVDRAVYAQQESIGITHSERYAVADIIGCTVLATGPDSNHHVRTLGTVTDVLLLPANDVWVVDSVYGHEVLIPVIDDVVRSVIITKKTIHVHLLHGMLPSASNSDTRDD